MKPILTLLTALLLAPLAALHAGELKLPAPFADHMVLQREQTVPVWGWAKPDEEVTVEFAGQKKTTRADVNGKWLVKLNPLKASVEPRELKVGSIVIHDVLVGEVWLASGQSNMGFSLREVGDLAPADVASSADPQLRLLTVKHHADTEPQAEMTPAPTWLVADPATVPGWSAVAYYYARNLRRALNVPVGIIHSSVGGTPAESWTSREALAGDPLFAKVTEESIAAWKRYPKDVRAFPILLAEWMKQNHAEDPGGTGEAQGWAKCDFDDSGWRDATIPTALRPLGMKGGGIVWFRKTIVFSADAAHTDTWIGTDWVDDAAQTLYLNGVRLEPIGSYQPYYHKQTRFKVPKAIIRAGAPNTLALRLHSLWPDRGFWQRTKAMNLPVTEVSLLDDHWRFKIEAPFPDLSPEAIKAMPHAPTANLLLNTYTSLYNAMIHPLIPFAIKGVIWYQGESNASRSAEYQHLLSLMMGDWRSRWHEGDFPFHMVQLANYGEPAKAPEESGVAGIREAQLRVAQTVPNVGMAVAIDVGEVSIHPRNKREVGRRLALVALAKTYGQEVVCCGPIYEACAIEGRAIRIRFAHTHGGLMAKDGELKRFAIAGEDKKFVWADAKIEGDTAVVNSPVVTKPVAVRYAWATNPEGCNLYNRAGLPASPFRTDDWK